MINVGIVGGTGYTGGELLRLLMGHPLVEIKIITSRSEVGRDVSEFFPNLRGHTDLCFSKPDIGVLKSCDVVFFAAPNGTAMTMVPDLLAADIRIIDLAADFRLKDAAQWERWYGQPHACPELLLDAVYGMPEINRDAIRNTRLVANPGCYPTAIVLGFLPLLEQKQIQPTRLIADAKSGTSGAGRKADMSLLMGEVSENFKAYSVAGHRHLPEILQCLANISKAEPELLFVPHLVPMNRGIHATLYAELTDTGLDLQQLYKTRYQGEPFVDVLEQGVHPETRNVRGTNICQIAVHQPQGGKDVVILSVIDNLVKGAAGQAVQNMNIMLGLSESAGLDVVALLP